MMETLTVAKFKSAIAAATANYTKISRGRVNPDAVILAATNAAIANPKLLECSAQSVVRALLQASELGLVPGSAMNHAYLTLLRSNEASLTISAQGLTHLMYNTGQIRRVDAAVVRRGDVFDYEYGTAQFLRHRPADQLDGRDNDTVTHAYAIIEMATGGITITVMTRGELDHVRSFSKSRGAYDVWESHYAEMARKSVVRRIAKYVPKSPELSRALALEDRNSIHGSEPIFEFEQQPADAQPDGTSKRLAGKLKPTPDDLLGLQVETEEIS